MFYAGLERATSGLRTCMQHGKLSLQQTHFKTMVQKELPESAFVSIIFINLIFFLYEDKVLMYLILKSSLLASLKNIFSLNIKNTNQTILL